MPPTVAAKDPEGVLKRRLATNVRRFRRVAGMTQTCAAAEAGLDLRHYKRIEAGENNTALSTLVKLANAFATTPADLVRAQPKRPEIRLPARQVSSSAPASARSFRR